MDQSPSETRRRPRPGRSIRRGLDRRGRRLADSVLRLIWEERRISRAELARRAGLARSTVSEVVGSLLPSGLIEEIGPGPSRGGRRPIVLAFQDDACCILGVEMGATHVAATLVDLRGHVLAWEKRDHPVRTDPDGTRRLIAQLCDACLATNTKNRPLVGLGIGVPCPVDPVDAQHLSEVVLPDWKGRAGFDALRARYDVPVLVDNDANVGALAEQWWGAGRGVDQFAYVKVATGVGSGHVIGGKIHRGSTGVAGEIGHLAIDPHGGPCVCGLRGCLTTFVGTPALEARARALLGEYPNSTLAHRAITITAIEDAALDGDALALAVVREAAEHLGTALAGMLNLMNPSRVIIGGGLARLGELLLEPLRETVRTRTLVSSLSAAEICTSELGPRTIAVGAATLVLERALDDARLFPTSADHAEVR